MKNGILSIFCLLFFIQTGYSQKKIGLTVFAGSGFSWFGGSNASRTANYYISDVTGTPNYTDKLFGRYAAPLTNAGISIRYKIQREWRLLLNLSHEFAGGRLNMYKSISRGLTEDIDASYTRRYQFVSINPALERSILQKKFTINLQGGLDIAPAFEVDELYKKIFGNNLPEQYGAGGGILSTTDWRLTGGVSFSVNKWSASLNYKHGINGRWEQNFTGVNTRMVQFRIMYQIIGS